MEEKTPEATHFWDTEKNVMFYYNCKVMKNYVGNIRKDDEKKEPKKNVSEIPDDEPVLADQWDSDEYYTDSDYTENSEENMLEFDEINMPPLREMFDLEGTLIEINKEEEWSFAEGVVDKFKNLAYENFFLVIISNQFQLKMDTMGSEKMYQFRKKFERIVNKLSQIFNKKGNLLYVFSIFIMDNNDIFYKKPFPGCWHIIQGVIPIKESKEPIKYIGANGGRSLDGSCIDRKFALNANLEYTTPEQYFLNSTDEDPFLWGFDPRMHINLPAHLPNSKEQIPNLTNVFTDEADSQYIVILIGYPGSGKTTFAKNIIAETEGYTSFHIISHEAYPRLDKAQKHLKKILDEGNNVIIDYTNHNKYERSGWILFSQDINPNIIVCTFEMTTSKDLSQHLNTLQARKKNNKKKLVLDRSYSNYEKTYEPVNTKAEGINRHYRIPFIPSFGSEDRLRKFLLMTK